VFLFEVGIIGTLTASVFIKQYSRYQGENDWIFGDCAKLEKQHSQNFLLLQIPGEYGTAFFIVAVKSAESG
jgi:hypothetical protein